MASSPSPYRRDTVYLGWDRPTLTAAADALVERYAADASKQKGVHFGKLLCVLPTARGARRLGELLTDRLSGNTDKYIPPTFVTAGELPEYLYAQTLPPAMEFERTLAWASVMRSADPSAMRALLPTLPAVDSISAWLELASTAGRLREELAADRLTFEQVAKNTDNQQEQQRWRLLAALAERYTEKLNCVGLVDLDSARADAVDKNVCRCDHTVVLVGTSDINDQLQAMLEKLEGDIITMIAAPASAKDRFEAFGRIKSSAWTDHRLPLRDDQLLPAGDVSDQAVAAAESLHSFDDSSSVIGVTDFSQVGPVEMELRGSRYRSFRGIGWTVGSTSVGRLFDLVANHLQVDTWQSLAALVRHGQLSQMITRSLGESTASAWLTELDGLLSSTYPHKQSGTLPPKAIDQYPQAIEVSRWVARLLSDFGGGEKTVADWCRKLKQLLVGTYAENDAIGSAQDTDPFLPGFLCDTAASEQSPPSGLPDHDRPDPTGLAVRAASKMLDQFALLNKQLDVKVSAGAAMEMIKSRLSQLRVVPPARPGEVPIVGWLDLALEDAQSISVVGLNHPFVPAAITSDPFLPGSLRSTLRMMDNERRLARDVYATHLILSVRKNVHFIVGKFAADGSPTPPSRLLAAADPVDLARRVELLLDGKRRLPRVTHKWDLQSSSTHLPIPVLPRSSDQPVLPAISVTGFKDYLTCPYRFYLRHVLKLKPLGDDQRELAANQFGDLVHGALEAFGQSPDKDQTQPSRIQDALIEHLHQYADHHYGSDVSVAVTLQIAQAERRLATFAKQQAARVDQGWIIHATEASVSPGDGARVVVPEGTMGLKGRFDRIDFHPETGKWAILDYKTHGHRPEKKHLQLIDGEKCWVDLQLPLYRMMIPFLGIEVPPETVQLGYFNISDKDEETKINLADFSEDQFAQADKTIHRCVSGILRQQFAPTDRRVEFDDYGMILREGIAGNFTDPAELSS